jgi:hypothetical protein
VVALARQVGVLHLRLGPIGALEVDTEGPPLGEAPPPVEAKTAAGSRVTLGGPGLSRLVVFVSPDCAICAQVLPGVPAAARAGGSVPLVIQDREAEAAFRVPGTPYALVLDRLGIVVAKGTVNNLEQLEGLIETARRRLEGIVKVPEVAGERPR